jgi:hypothetical protein
LTAADENKTPQPAQPMHEDPKMIKIAHHQIISVSDDNHTALGYFLAPGFYP